MRPQRLVMIGGSSNIAVESIAAPTLSAPRPVHANVAAGKPPDDELKKELASRART
jgi:hypothetical protein